LHATTVPFNRQNRKVATLKIVPAPSLKHESVSMSLCLKLYLYLKDALAMLTAYFLCPISTRLNCSPFRNTQNTLTLITASSLRCLRCGFFITLLFCRRNLQKRKGNKSTDRQIDRHLTTSAKIPKTNQNNYKQ